MIRNEKNSTYDIFDKRNERTLIQTLQSLFNQLLPNAFKKKRLQIQ